MTSGHPGIYTTLTDTTLARFAKALPAVRGLTPGTLARHPLRLHDTQSCIAREYGFASWADLRTHVEISRLRSSDPDALATAFLDLVYSSDIAGGMTRSRPHLAARLLEEHPNLVRHDPWIACAAGDVGTVRATLAGDPDWVNRQGGKLDLTPLIATTHSSLLTLGDHGERLRTIVSLLLDAGADPNRCIERTWQLSSRIPAETWQVSALHGAAGVNHDPALTGRLLAAGADPNDGESLYHSLDNPVCTPLLLEAGATVTGTNALMRCLDFDDIDTFRLLLAHAGESEELSDGRVLLHAIRRRRSRAHVEAILAAGADPSARSGDGVSARIQAVRNGLTEVAELLGKADGDTRVSEKDAFLSACAQADESAAREILSRRADLPASLDPVRLKLLPELAEAGCAEAVKLMVDLGWPIDVAGGDWSASALNHAVFQGNASLADHLLAHGASWHARHAFGDDVCGTLSWASVNRPRDDGDWVGCAQVLRAHGLARALRDPAHPECVLLEGRRRLFDEDVSALLLGEARDDAPLPPQ
ncbi:MAG: hypothetical protein CMN87_06930 [Stappia sp.]|nr:hypothetical protein [Stappia sp.]MBM19726.1 hypothetical protein [Stappia sp.]